MAEDQGINGDAWNDQASTLLKALKWEQIGDSNIDLPTDDGEEHGIDRVFKFFNSTTNRDEGVLVEAKRYNTDSLSFSVFDKWIKTLDRKLTNLKNSKELFEKFPELENLPLRTGVIVIWFHNILEYENFKPKLIEYQRNVKINKKNVPSNKIYVFENEKILRMASLHNSINLLNGTINKKLLFYYPSVDLSSAKRSDVLNPIYMFSKFILADYINNEGIENKVVFYFGDLKYVSFERLGHALSTRGYLDSDKPLTIYNYQRDDEEFRKIKPDLNKIFKGTTLFIEEMEHFMDLPTFMRR